jgi:hypothetical protein
MGVELIAELHRAAAAPWAFEDCLSRPQLETTLSASGFLEKVDWTPQYSVYRQASGSGSSVSAHIQT